MFTQLLEYLQSLSFPQMVTHAAALGAVVSIVVNLLKKIVERRRFHKLHLRGYFVSERDMPGKARGIVELIHVAPAGFGIGARPIYIFDDHDYRMELSFSREHNNVIHGEWRSLRDPKNFGAFGWNHGDHLIDGFWSATTRIGQIEFGAWRLKRVPEKMANYIESKVVRRWWQRAILPIRHRLEASHLCDNILKKHREKPRSTFRINRREYDVFPTVFNPDFGKISKPLIEYLLDLDLSAYRRVLDWGTGSGFYAVELASWFREREQSVEVFALESDMVALSCAQHNVAKHSMAEVIEIHYAARISDAHELQREEFDLIVANLPFSRPAKLYPHRRDPMYHCFCAEPQMILDLCCEISHSLALGGRAFMTFADSGDGILLASCLELVGLTAREVLRIDETCGATDDLFYAYELAHR